MRISLPWLRPERTTAPASLRNIALGAYCEHGKKHYRDIFRVDSRMRVALGAACDQCGATRITLKGFLREKAICGGDFPWAEWVTREPRIEQAEHYAMIRSAFGWIGKAVLLVLVVGEIYVARIFCTSHYPTPTIARPSNEAVIEDGKALEAASDAIRLNQANRIIGVYWRLLLANNNRCDPNARQTGAFFSTITDHLGQERTIHRRVFGSTSTTIYAVADQSPAQMAGLRKGDVVTAIDGDVIDQKIPFEAFARSIIEKTYGKNLVHLAIERNHEKLQIDLAPIMACPYQLGVMSKKEINATQNGTKVWTSTYMLDLGLDDDAVAAMLGHEIAHGVLKHPTLPEESVLNSLFAFGHALAPQSHFLNEYRDRHNDLELMADKLGLEISTRAGFDAVGAYKFRLFSAHFLPEWTFSSSFTHPGHALRNVLLPVSRNKPPPE